MLTVSEEPLKYTSLSFLTLLQDKAANNSQALKIYIISVLFFWPWLNDSSSWYVKKFGDGEIFWCF